VGAGGLMQLMPGTAQLVAKKIGIGPISREQMNDLDTNILLGTNYLAMVYNQFDDSPCWPPPVTTPVRDARRSGVPRSRTGRGRDFAETFRLPNPRLRQERALEHRVLRGAVRRPSAIAESALGYIAP